MRLDVWAVHRLRRWMTRRYWERRWARPDFAAPWTERDVAGEIVAAVEEGWFPRGAHALDVGCGSGEVTAWLAARGFPSLGIDISAAAVERARARHGQSSRQIEFRQLDICAATPADDRFEVLVDRGCFHTIAVGDAPDYARHVAIASRDGARFLLLVKAYRNGVPFGDREETARLVARVESALARDFSIDRIAPTDLGAGSRGGARAPSDASSDGPSDGPTDGRAQPSLPGLAVWMTRRPRSPNQAGPPDGR